MLHTIMQLKYASYYYATKIYKQFFNLASTPLNSMSMKAFECKAASEWYEQKHLTYKTQIYKKTTTISRNKLNIYL